MYIAFVDSEADIVQPTQNTNIFLVYSDDSGQTWSIPLQLNVNTRNSSNLQPKLRIDPQNDDVFVAWLSADDNPNDIKVRPYFVSIPRSALPAQTCRFSSDLPEVFYDNDNGDVVCYD